MKQVHIFISGGVQGVGYRQFVKSIAGKQEISGWVKNLDDGRVEAVLQGEENAILAMLTVLRAGPFLADVKAIAVSWEEVSEQFHGYTVF